MKEGTTFPGQEKSVETSSATHDEIKIKSQDRTVVRRKKRGANLNAKVLSRNEILAMIKNIPDKMGGFQNKGKMYKAMISLLYMTGARINELLTLKKSQFEFTEDQETGMKYLVINNIPTLKRKVKFPRSQFMRKDIEGNFIDFVKVWMNELTSDDALLFPIKDSRAWQIVFKYTGMFPHYFRHVRNIDLVRLYGFNSFWLQRWNGWSKLQSSESYVNLVGEDLKNKILEVKKKIG